MPNVLNPGQPVRVVVMFEEARQFRDVAISRLTVNSVPLAEDRLATLVPHPDAIIELCEDTMVLPDFLPFSRGVGSVR